jgi:hypothetical protein
MCNKKSFFNLIYKQWQNYKNIFKRQTMTANISAKTALRAIFYIDRMNFFDQNTRRFSGIRKISLFLQFHE